MSARRRDFKGERDFFMVEVIASAVDDTNAIATIENCYQSKATFSAHRLVNALAVWPAFDGAILV